MKLRSGPTILGTSVPSHFPVVLPKFVSCPFSLRTHMVFLLPAIPYMIATVSQYFPHYNVSS